MRFRLRSINANADLRTFAPDPLCPSLRHSFYDRAQPARAEANGPEQNTVGTLVRAATRDGRQAVALAD
jgi:hypothetical protein